MIVVSDTSPINNLAAIGQLLLLKQLYETVVPEAVYSELVGPPGPPMEAGAEEVRTYDWIKVQGVVDRSAVERLLS